MKKAIRIVLVVLLGGSFIWGAFFLYRKSQAAPTEYQTETSFTATIIKKAVASGSVTAENEINIKPQVSGVIEEFYTEEGQIIKKGDLIAKIKLIPSATSLNNAEASLRISRVNYNNAKTEMERNEKLLSEGVISETEFNRFKLNFDQAKEQLNADRSNVTLLKKGSSKAGSASTLVRATAAGMVLDLPIEAGDFVIESNTFNDGTTVAVIADMTNLIFEGMVDESDVGKLKEGMPVKLKIGAIDDKIFDAKLAFISPKGIEEDGAIKFEVKAPIKPDSVHFIRAGYSANADIVLASADSVMSIRESLLQFEGDKVFVEVKTADGKFERREIKTGLSDGINVEVLSGITATEQIKVYQGKARGE